MRSTFAASALAFNMVEDLVLKSGTEGIKQTEVSDKVSTETGVGKSTVARHVNTLLAKKVLINEGGHKKYRLLTHRNSKSLGVLKPAHVVIDTPPVPTALPSLNFKISPDGKRLSFVLAGLTIGIEVTE